MQTKCSSSIIDPIAGYSSSYSNQDPLFGPYNMLMCRPGKIASFPLNSSISKTGLDVAMDFYPYSDESSIQTIFSIRNTATNFVSLRCDYFSSTGSLNIWINPNPSVGNPYYVFNTATTTSVPIRNGKLQFVN